MIIQEGLSALGDPSTLPRHDSAEVMQTRTLQLWFARKAALEASDPIEAQARVEELRAYMLQQGITADRMVARGFAYEGYENLREGNYERAREAFDVARSFDPYLPQAQLGYAWSLLRSGRGIFVFLNEYGRGLRLACGQFMIDEVQMSNVTVAATLALLCSMMVFSLVVVARCQGRARHDLFEAARRILPEGGARWTAWLIFLLPLLAWAGGLWLILYWLTLCFRYMRLPEKAVAACVFLMIGLAPLGVEVVLDRIQASTDPEIRVAVVAMQAGYNPETLERLKEVVARHDEHAELHLLLGTAYAKGDLLGEAFHEYQTVLEKNPAEVSALINIGNIYFRLGEYAQAANSYKQAAQIRPDLPSAFWNLHLAQTELLHFAEADASLARARELNQGLTGRLLARKGGEGGHALLLEEAARLGRIKASLRSRAPLPAERAHALENPLSMASGAGLILALLLGIGGSSRPAQACARCGRAHCARCCADQRASGCCARCVHLFVKRDGITAEMHTEQMARFERRDRRTATFRRILSILLPGSGHILADRLGIGFPVMTGWVGALFFMVARDRLLLAPRVPVSDLPPPGVVLAILLMVILWIVGNAASTRQRFVAGAPDGA